MKKRILSRLVPLAVIGMLALQLGVFAKDAVNKEVLKLKTQITSMEGKEKVETVTTLLKGVDESTFDSEKKVLTVKYDPKLISPFMLQYTIEKLGYKSEVVENNNEEAAGKDEKKEEEQ